MNASKGMLATGLFGLLLAACSSDPETPAAHDSTVAGNSSSSAGGNTAAGSGTGGTHSNSSQGTGASTSGGTAASASSGAGGTNSSASSNTIVAGATNGGAASGGGTGADAGGVNAGGASADTTTGGTAGVRTESSATAGGVATGGATGSVTPSGGTASGGAETFPTGGAPSGGTDNLTTGGAASGGAENPTMGGTGSGGVVNPATGGDATGGDTSVVSCTADTQNDAKNCGACGNTCDLFAAYPKCILGNCEIDHCAVGYVDLNQFASDGCERPCIPSNGGVEVCDDIDNDCNGVVDDGFDLMTDVHNCGACGNACNLPHSTASCSISGATALCQVASCEEGYADINQLTQDGCEYKCPVWPPQPEACDGIDNDCNAQVNEANPGGGAACDSNCPNGTCLGECTSGVTQCVGSTLICKPGKGPSTEVCNNKDDDCDGTVDNGFDLQNDVQNCGACGTVCNLPNAIASCASGACVIAVCLPGFGNLDGIMENGCEFGCAVNPPTVETCNGIDDDCDGMIDNPSSIAAQKPPQTGCYPKAGTPCEGADFVCTGATGWRCNYGNGVEVAENGDLATAEAFCDGIDGNCNGQIDETFADLNNSCDNGLLGACRDVGKRVCDPSDPRATVCDLSVLPDPVPGTPRVETCNGLDDDCNGQIDDGIVDDMVAVTVGAATIYVDRFEASRPDATSSNAGLNEARRCVNAGVLPWTSASYAEAANACSSVGARLCTAAELQAACEAPTAAAYPYGTSYVATNCNGNDYDAIPGGSIEHRLVPAGSNPSCVSQLDIYDLSGNAAEWTSTVTGNTGGTSNLNIYMAKGGSYLTPAIGLTCQFSMSVYASNAILPELGFRCCKGP